LCTRTPKRYLGNIPETNPTKDELRKELQDAIFKNTDNPYLTPSVILVKTSGNRRRKREFFASA
jgi:predicted metal-dependent RNase